MGRNKNITTIKKQQKTTTRGTKKKQTNNNKTQKYEVTRKQSKQIVIEKTKQC